MLNRLLRAIVAFASVATPACAAPTHFGFKQIIVAGSSNVQAYALNNKSAIAGVYMDGTGGHAFVLAGSTLTVLPPPGPCDASYVPFPTAINAAGDVVGGVTCGEGFGFLWQNGAYVAAAAVQLGYNQVTIGINNKRELFYVYYGESGDNLDYAGDPGAFMQVTPTGYGSIVSSLNNRGVLAGTANLFSSKVVDAVFLYNQGAYTYFVPPGAIASYDGFINDKGAIAGAYETKKHAYRGFVYEAGQYKSYVIPSNPKKVAVQALNSSGRVAGVYTDAARNVQRIFLFNGTTVSVFGRFPPTDQIHVGLNDEGTMLVSDTGQSSAETWRVLCGGLGC